MGTQFLLSVWRPAKLSRSIDYPTTTSDGDFVFESEKLQEQLYIWDPGENDVSSALDEKLAEEFHRLLFEKFDPSLVAEQRSIVLLSQIVSELNTKLNNATTTPWAYSAQEVRQDQAGEANLRVNAPQALLNHLLWIVRVFGHVPSASVTVR